MTTYDVHVVQFWTYRIDADSPEDAAQSIDDGDAPTGECTGYNIEAVAHPDTDDDLRANVDCRGGCGKRLPASHHGMCLDCLLGRTTERAS